MTTEGQRKTEVRDAMRDLQHIAMLGVMSHVIRILVASLTLSCFAGCVTLPAHRTLARMSVGKTATGDGQHARFTKAEFRELLVHLRPLFEESGFRCYDDGARGGFSIIEGPIHWASYGIAGDSGTWLHCSIKATRKGLRLEVEEYEDKRGTGIFTTTKTETDAIAHVIQSVRDFLRSSYPDVTFEVKNR